MVRPHLTRTAVRAPTPTPGTAIPGGTPIPLHRHRSGTARRSPLTVGATFPAVLTLPLPLPGVLDIEWNPYGASRYGLGRAAMVDWIRDFTTTYRARTGRDAVIYTATSWWKECTGDNAGFGATNPLRVARYDTTVGELPAGRPVHTMWQYTATGPIVGDHNRFNGAPDRVQALANG